VFIIERQRISLLCPKLLHHHFVVCNKYSHLFLVLLNSHNSYNVSIKISITNTLNKAFHTTENPQVVNELKLNYYKIYPISTNSFAFGQQNEVNYQSTRPTVLSPQTQYFCYIKYIISFIILLYLSPLVAAKYHVVTSRTSFILQFSKVFLCLKEVGSRLLHHNCYHTTEQLLDKKTFVPSGNDMRT
jgi:hypothetical protein